MRTGRTSPAAHGPTGRADCQFGVPSRIVQKARNEAPNEPYALRRTPWARSRTARKATERAPGDHADPDLSEIPGSHLPSVSVADAVRIAATACEAVNTGPSSRTYACRQLHPSDPGCAGSAEQLPSTRARRRRSPRTTTRSRYGSGRPRCGQPGPERCRRAETAPCAAPITGTGAPPRLGKRSAVAFAQVRRLGPPHQQCGADAGNTPSATQVAPLSRRSTQFCVRKNSMTSEPPYGIEP
jgi:hypothetical protein